MFSGGCGAIVIPYLYLLKWASAIAGRPTNVVSRVRRRTSLSLRRHACPPASIYRIDCEACHEKPSPSGRPSKSKAALPSLPDRTVLICVIPGPLPLTLCGGTTVRSESLVWRWQCAVRSLPQQGGMLVPAHGRCTVLRGITVRLNLTALRPRAATCSPPHMLPAIGGAVMPGDRGMPGMSSWWHGTGRAHAVARPCSRTLVLLSWQLASPRWLQPARAAASELPRCERPGHCRTPPADSTGLRPCRQRQLRSGQARASLARGSAAILPGTWRKRGASQAGVGLPPRPSAPDLRHGTASLGPPWAWWAYCLCSTRSFRGVS